MKNSVKRKRIDRGWSQEDLAAKLNVSRQTIISIEKEKFDPSLPLAFQIANLFEITIEDIFHPAGSIRSDDYTTS